MICLHMGCEANDVVKSKLESAAKGTGSPALQPCIPLQAPAKCPGRAARLPREGLKGHGCQQQQQQGRNSHLWLTCSDQLHRRGKMRSSVRIAVPSPSPPWLIPEHSSSFCQWGCSTPTSSQPCPALIIDKVLTNHPLILLPFSQSERF